MARTAGWAALALVVLLLPLRVYPVLAVDILVWALFATAFVLIAAIDSPRSGLIRVNAQNLLNLAEQLH